MQRTSLGWLLDVNALIALLDPNHVHHEAMHVWFSGRHPRTWATCALTENGLIRVLAQPSYPGGPFAPAQTIGILRRLKANHSESHELWTNDVSLTERTLFRVDYLVTPRQVTDVYLLGLAYRRRGRVVSFDRHLAWEAIEGGTAALVENPPVTA
jgi:toxin-antitoxin system PIN domain toxin